MVLLTHEEQAMAERMMERATDYQRRSDEAAAQLLTESSDKSLLFQLHDARQSLDRTMAHMRRLSAEAERRGLVGDKAECWDSFANRPTPQCCEHADVVLSKMETGSHEESPVPRSYFPHNHADLSVKSPSPPQ
jgi:hypothetical protein